MILSKYSIFHWLRLDQSVFTLTDDKKCEKKFLDPPVVGACAIFVPGATFRGKKFLGLRFNQFWCLKICIYKKKTEQKTRSQYIEPSKSYKQKRLQNLRFLQIVHF